MVSNKVVFILPSTPHQLYTPTSRCSFLVFLWSFLNKNWFYLHFSLCLCSEYVVWKWMWYYSGRGRCSWSPCCFEFSWLCSTRESVSAVSCKIIRVFSRVTFRTRATYIVIQFLGVRRFGLTSGTLWKKKKN